MDSTDQETAKRPVWDRGSIPRRSTKKSSKKFAFWLALLCLVLYTRDINKERETKMNNIEIIGTFDWGTVRIHGGNVATVERTNGHMNKAQLIEALAQAGYRIASAGKAMNVPHIKARSYEIKAA